MKWFRDQEVTVAGQPMTYGKLLTACVNNPPQGGFSVEEMKARLRIISAVDDAKDGVIELEDADYKKARTCVDGMRWTVMDKKIMQFSDDFVAAEKITPKSAEGVSHG